MAEQETTPAETSEAAKAEGPKVRIDGTEYAVADLSETARAQVQSLRFVDNEIQRLNALLATINTARNAYLVALKEAIAVEEGQND